MEAENKIFWGRGGVKKIEPHTFFVALLPMGRDEVWPNYATATLRGQVVLGERRVCCLKQGANSYVLANISTSTICPSDLWAILPLQDPHTQATPATTLGG